MIMNNADKLWLIANTVDYVCGLMIDYYLYSIYEKEITQAYAKGRITSVGEFRKYLDDFIDRHAGDYQVNDVYDIAMGVIDMVAKF